MITITKSGLPNQESTFSALRFCVASPKRRGPSLPHSIETSVVYYKQIEKLRQWQLHHPLTIQPLQVLWTL
jgi:hypothetical protein